MERISGAGRLICFLSLIVLLSACAHMRTPPFDGDTFLEGRDYTLITEQGSKEEVLARYESYFEEILEREDHANGAAIRFRHQGVVYQVTLVPDDLGGGDWALFFVRP